MPENKKLPTEIQIHTAHELYEKMEYWKLADKILAKLKENNPSLTDQKLTLVKATLVNSFYSAGCSDIENITSWVVNCKPNHPEVYRNIDSNDDVGPINLVQHIALRGRTGTANQIQGYVFASKFAHFFIDTDAFPIYDQYARMLVHFHTDDLNKEEQPNRQYGEYGIFHQKFFQLKKHLEQRDSAFYSTKTIDCYLWLAGQYVAWKKGIRKKFYLASHLQLDDPDNQHLLEMLFPQVMVEDVTDKL